MAIEVFNRFEKKYRISDELFRIIKPQLEEYMEVDEHSRNGEFYTICNLYYDTVNNDLIRKSIEKPVYKEKLRVRSYGEAGLSDMVFVEIKKKFGGCVNKRRTSMTLGEAYHYLETGQKPKAKNPLNEQIQREIDYLLYRYPTLQPALYLSYERNALFGIEDRSFRITFDNNLLTRRYDLGLEYGIYGEPLLPQDQWIMEVKVNRAAPLWFAELLSRYRIYPTSFSKYGMEFQKTLLHNDGVVSEINKMYV